MDVISQLTWDQGTCNGGMNLNDESSPGGCSGGSGSEGGSGGGSSSIIQGGLTEYSGSGSEERSEQDGETSMVEGCWVEDITQISRRGCHSSVRSNGKPERERKRDREEDKNILMLLEKNKKLEEIVQLKTRLERPLQAQGRTRPSHVLEGLGREQ